MTTEHHSTVVHGFAVLDTTQATPGYWQGELIWVGHNSEGRWLTPAEARELAQAITAAATAATARQHAAEVPA